MGHRCFAISTGNKTYATNTNKNFTFSSLNIHIRNSFLVSDDSLLQISFKKNGKKNLRCRSYFCFNFFDVELETIIIENDEDVKRFVDATVKLMNVNIIHPPKEIPNCGYFIKFQYEEELLPIAKFKTLKELEIEVKKYRKNIRGYAYERELN